MRQIQFIEIARRTKARRPRQEIHKWRKSIHGSKTERENKRGRRGESERNIERMNISEAASCLLSKQMSKSFRLKTKFQIVAKWIEEQKCEENEAHEGVGIKQISYGTMNE